MVLINRHQRPPPVQRQMSCPGGLPSSEKLCGSGSHPVSARGNPCAMGDTDACSVSSISNHSYHSLNGSLNGSFSFAENAPKRTSLNSDTLLPSFNSSKPTVNSNRKLSRWMLPLLYVVTFASWIRAIQYRSTSSDIVVALDAEIGSLSLQKGRTLNLLMEAKKSRGVLEKQQQKLQKTQHLFAHEIRMIEELYEEDNSGGDLQNIPEETWKEFQKRKSAGVADSWLNHRLEALLHKVYGLQAFLKEESRKRVLEKYGPGPHQVHFHVLSREGRKPGDFVVELAPLDLMPHSIEAFLDMVVNRVWDNSVFYHHLSQGHVVAAAPVSYGTFQSKQHQMESLGYTGVSFPEYSKEFPHQQYTLGFAGNGPNFYINTMDNTDHHGPGGQGHHDLATDADPCFAKVVSGFDVISKDMMTGRHKGRRPTGWEDFDLTRIASVTLVKPSKTMK